MRAGATGIGSLPVDLAARGRVADPRETARIVADAFPGLPHMVELPGRGAGADMVGRTAAMLASISSDFAVQTVPTGWRRTARPGIDTERAGRRLDQDCDAIAEVFSGYAGPFKLQVCGPLTWCRVVEDQAGEPSLRDPGFISDVVAATGEAARVQAARLRRVVPGVTAVVVQVDEPAMAQVLAGAVPTASGRGRVRPQDAQQVRAWLATLAGAVHTDGATEAWLHSCADASHIPYTLAAGFDAVSFDVSRLPAASLDAVGTAHDSGLRLVLGVVGPDEWRMTRPQMTDVARTRAERLRSALGLPEQEFAHAVTLTPACGLAGATPQQARDVMSAIGAASRSVCGETMDTSVGPGAGDGDGGG